MQGVISLAIRSEQRQEPHDTENTAILKHNKVLNNYNTTCERQFMKKKERGYFPEDFRKIRSYFPEDFRNIRSYFPEYSGK